MSDLSSNTGRAIGVSPCGGKLGLKLLATKEFLETFFRTATKTADFSSLALPSASKRMSVSLPD